MAVFPGAGIQTSCRTSDFMEYKCLDVKCRCRVRCSPPVLFRMIVRFPIRGSYGSASQDAKHEKALTRASM
eukprot:14730458-Alexandrium_andersonii.AAC.1